MLMSPYTGLAGCWVGWQRIEVCGSDRDWVRARRRRESQDRGFIKVPPVHFWRAPLFDFLELPCPPRWPARSSSILGHLLLSLPARTLAQKLPDLRLGPDRRAPGRW